MNMSASLQEANGLTPYNERGHCSSKLHTLANQPSSQEERERKSYVSMEENPISNIRFPPGIRFHPSDEELISHYLERKVKSLPLPVDVITDIELYRYNPWDLPRKTLFGEDEWYFFTPRDRKYPKGGRPNRTAASGYWKATGTDKPIFSSCGSRKIGVKKSLVFYQGKPPNGHKMNWTMTEYRLPDASRPSRPKGSMRLDDWVLCRIRQKGNMSKNEQSDEQSSSDCNNREMTSVCIQDSRDMLAEYLQSSEHHRIVSLLLGDDPRLVISPTTTFQSQESGNFSRTICEDRTDQTNTEANLCLLQCSTDPSLAPLNMITNEQKDVACQIVSGDNKGKPNYSSNTYINLEELHMPALQEYFIQ